VPADSRRLFFRQYESWREAMIMKLLFALGAPFICITLIALPGSPQAGTIYDCRDRSGSVILTDAPLGEGYNCKPKESFQDASAEEKAAWEKERTLATEKWMQEEQAKEAAEKRKQEEEAARKKQLEDSAPRYMFW
jgi:hypothetical protein